MESKSSWSPVNNINKRGSTNHWLKRNHKELFSSTTSTVTCEAFKENGKKKRIERKYNPSRYNWLFYLQVAMINKVKVIGKRTFIYKKTRLTTCRNRTCCYPIISFVSLTEIPFLSDQQRAYTRNTTLRKRTEKKSISIQELT